MNLAVGTDCVLLSRIEQAIQNPRFVQRILSEEELIKNLDVKYIAGRWAAKEAIYKALTNFNITLSSFKKISILSNAQGAPYVVIHPSIDLGDIRLSLSISHEKTLAIATAVAWKI